MKNKPKYQIHTDLGRQILTTISVWEGPKKDYMTIIHHSHIENMKWNKVHDKFFRLIYISGIQTYEQKLHGPYSNTNTETNICLVMKNKKKLDMFVEAIRHTLGKAIIEPYKETKVVQPVEPKPMNTVQRLWNQIKHWICTVSITYNPFIKK